MPIPITSATAGVLALLFVGLAAYVSRLRMARGISLGDGGDRELNRAIRAHANLAEFAPLFLILLLALEWRGAATGFVATLAVTFVLARLAHAAGLMQRATSPPRQIGAGVSYLLVVVAALALLSGLL